MWVFGCFLSIAEWRVGGVHHVAAAAAAHWKLEL